MNRIICLLAFALMPAAVAQVTLPPAGQYDRDDIRAYGADCTGHAGSTSAIQNALAASKVVRIPSPCYLKADAEIRIEGARAGDGWRLYGTGMPDFTGDMPGGAVIFGCGAWTGPVFDINRTGHWEIYGIKVEATPDTQVKPLCPSGSLASGSFLVENDTSRGGFTQTNFKFDHVAFDYGGQPRPAGGAQPYIALQVGTGHGSNNENMESGNIVNSSFQGREQPGSIAIQVLACCAQSYTISNLKPFMGFYRGFTGNFGGMVEHVNAGDEGGYRQFGPGGALFALTGCADGLTVNDVSTSELSGHIGLLREPPVWAAWLTLPAAISPWTMVN